MHLKCINYYGWQHYLYITFAEAELGDVLLAIASDVSQYWQSLVGLLGMDARRDVQKIQHECRATAEGSISLAQVYNILPLGL